MARPTGSGVKPLADRFWAKVAKTEGCWEWTGCRLPFGHGQVFIRQGGRRGRSITMLAHRLSWELAIGPIPAGLKVLHRCDNPPCVRPDHLFLGTAADNVADCHSKGRQNHVGKPGNKNAAKLSAAQVADIRARYIPRVITLKSLAAEYGVSEPAVHAIVHRHRWSE
jgi:hypothetical protein